MKSLSKSKLMIVILILFFSGVNGGKVFSLYTDHRAMEVDDILTILIVESAQAGSKSSSNTAKDHSYGLEGASGSGVLDFLPSFGASGGMSTGFDGKAGTERTGNLKASISARVIKVLDNGNLVIEGNKVVEINEEKEIITISGIVRPEDIEANNTIYSSNIANSQISYSGKGTVEKGQRPGLLTKLLNWIF